MHRLPGTYTFNNNDAFWYKLMKIINHQISFQGYKLMVQKRGVDTDPPSVVTVPSDTSNILGRQSTVLQHLEKFTEYTISVLCYTSVGDGPVSITVSEKTLEDGEEIVYYR